MTRALQKQTSLHDFSYDTYLTHCDIGNFHTLETDRRFLQDRGQDGDQFLLSLFSRHLARHPLNPASLDQVRGLVDLADSALSYSPDGDGRASIYRTVGYLLLDELTTRTKEAISRKRLIQGTREAQYVLRALSERGYSVAFPMTRWEKLGRHVRERNWSYIADRLWLEIVQHRSTVLITMLVASVAVIFRRFFTRHRGRTEKMT